MRALNIFAPPCQDCERPSWKLFCEECQEKMRIFELPTLPLSDLWDKLLLEFNYTKGAEAWLHDIKFNRRPERWRDMADLGLSSIPSRFQILSPSSDPIQKSHRLFDSSESFARELSRIWSLDYLGAPFIRKPFLSSQKRLSREERESSMGSLISLKPEWQRPLGSVLLVDDVMTTGATIKTHARLLRPFCKELWIYCLFHVARRLE